MALIGVEAAGDGIDTGRHGAPLTAGGRSGVLHGSLSAIMQDEDGQILEAHSISAGLDYPGGGPRARVAARSRPGAGTSRSPMLRRCEAFALCARLEGIIPALESSHALAYALDPAESAARPRLPVRPGRQGSRRGARAAGPRLSGIEMIAAAFAVARDERRAALMPYMMGGFPDLAASAEIGAAYVSGGADLIELGVPYSDPLADGPVIHAAGTQALAAGVRLSGVLEIGASLAERVPVVLMCYVNLILARGVERFADELAGAGISGLIVPDLPLEEAPAVASACLERGLALVPLVAPTTSDERLREITGHAHGFVYLVSVRGTTGERSSLDAGLAELRGARPGRERRQACRWRSASASARRRRSPPPHAAGADGVIIGTRLVREAAEAAEPATATGQLVAEFAAALRASGGAG